MISSNTIGCVFSTGKDDDEIAGLVQEKSSHKRQRGYCKKESL